MPNIDGAWLALIGTLFGGAGLKVIEAYLGRTRAKQDQGASIREELRLELTGLRQEIANAKVEEIRLEKEVDTWRNMYYEQFVKSAALATEFKAAQEKVVELQATVAGLNTKITNLENKIAGAS